MTIMDHLTVKIQSLLLNHQSSSHLIVYVMFNLEYLVINIRTIQHLQFTLLYSTLLYSTLLYSTVNIQLQILNYYRTIFHSQFFLLRIRIQKLTHCYHIIILPNNSSSPSSAMETWLTNSTNS